MLSIVVLVIAMTVNGQDIERHEMVGSVSECWEMAAERMNKLYAQREHANITKIAVGCVIDFGKTL